jgi:hypothetical protein
MEKVYSLATDVKLYETYANCDESEFGCLLGRSKRYAYLPKSFEYFDYALRCGIFKADKFTKDSDCRKPLNPDLIFTYPPFERDKEELWIRVWYKQIWKGFIEEARFNPYKISDQLILWTFHELGIQKKYREDITRGEAWKICKEKIQKRYFSMNPIKLILLFSRKDETCLLHEDVFALDLFKIIWSISFLRYPEIPKREYPKKKKVWVSDFALFLKKAKEEK